MPAAEESEHDPEVVVCDAAALRRVDLATVERLARLQMCARQLGWRVRLRHVPAELAELLALVGLDQVLGIESVGQAEQGEQPGSVEE